MKPPFEQTKVAKGGAINEFFMNQNGIIHSQCRSIRLPHSLKPTCVHTVANTPPLPVGAFSLIVADPPWSYHLRESEQKHRGRCPYPAMTDEEIMAMPVSSIAAPDSYLLLWTTNNHLPVAFRVMEAWGFEYKAIHTWVKTTLDRSKIRYGVGHYGRNATEHILIGRKGKAKTFMALGLTNIPTAFQAPLGQHSQKPEEFYQLADRLGDALGGQRIELFARCPRPGWESWGAEA